MSNYNTTTFLGQINIYSRSYGRVNSTNKKSMSKITNPDIKNPITPSSIYSISTKSYNNIPISIFDLLLDDDQLNLESNVFTINKMRIQRQIEENLICSSPEPTETIATPTPTPTPTEVTPTPTQVTPTPTSEDLSSSSSSIDLSSSSSSSNVSSSSSSGCATPPENIDTNNECYTTVVTNDIFCCISWDSLCQQAYDDCLSTSSSSSS